MQTLTLIYLSLGSSPPACLGGMGTQEGCGREGQSDRVEVRGQKARTFPFLNWNVPYYDKEARKEIIKLRLENFKKNTGFDCPF